MSRPKVMVALREGASLESLVTLACQLSQGMGADLTALHVVEVPPLTPLEAADVVIDQPGKELLGQAKRVADGLSHHLSTEIVRARDVGEAIVGAARDERIDLLVVGHHQPRSHALSETFFGGIVRYVAHHAPCRVIVQIPAPEIP